MCVAGSQSCMHCWRYSALRFANSSGVPALGTCDGSRGALPPDAASTAIPLASDSITGHANRRGRIGLAHALGRAQCGKPSSRKAGTNPHNYRDLSLTMPIGSSPPCALLRLDIASFRQHPADLRDGRGSPVDGRRLPTIRRSSTVWHLWRADASEPYNSRPAESRLSHLEGANDHI